MRAMNVVTSPQGILQKYKKKNQKYSWAVLEIGRFDFLYF